MRPWSPGVCVSEIMYNPNGIIKKLEAMETDPTITYFMSSEALCRFNYMMDALARKFEIVLTVLTVRSSLPMILSEYCWSGWLARAPGAVRFPGRLDKVAKDIAALSAYGPVTLCPIEPANLSTRFCEALAGHAPEVVEQISKRAGSVNVSISPALAEALHWAVKSRTAAPVPGPMRHSVVKMAMANKGPASFYDLMPQQFLAAFRNADLVEEELAEYGALLSARGVSDSVRDEALAISRSQIAGIASRAPADEVTKAVLREHAALIISKIEKAHPHAFA